MDNTSRIEDIFIHNIVDETANKMHELLDIITRLDEELTDAKITIEDLEFQVSRLIDKS